MFKLTKLKERTLTLKMRDFENTHTSYNFENTYISYNFTDPTLPTYLFCLQLVALDLNRMHTC